MPIGQSIAESVGGRLGLGGEMGGYVAGSVLVLLSIISLVIGWYVVTKHRAPGYAVAFLCVVEGIVLAWSGLWAWWIPAIMILVVLMLITIRKKGGETE